MNAIIDRNVKRKLKHQLVAPFKEKTFSACAINFGPRTVCNQHRDGRNLSYGWCAVTALGAYDHTRGGHLVLWDLGVAAEMYPGSTILFPSATVKHSNTPIAEHETRASVAQYTHGPLFAWEHLGHKSEIAAKQKWSRKKKAEMALQAAARFDKGRGMLSNLSELSDRYALVSKN